MKKLMLTGFEPFLDFPINPSEQIVRALDGEIIGEYEVTGRILPVEFSKSGSEAVRLFKEIQPDAVISLGLAGGRNEITIERVAINCIDGEADNSGVQLSDVPVITNGPTAYFSTLPIRRMKDNLRHAGYPAEISNTAGLYLCNNVMYHLLHTVSEQGRDIPAGFIHLPATHELAVTYKRSIPSWDLSTLTHAIRACITSVSG